MLVLVTIKSIAANKEVIKFSKLKQLIKTNL